MNHNTIAPPSSLLACASHTSYMEHINNCYKWFHNSLTSFLYIAKSARKLNYKG